ncbi:MAG: hypothetical protein WCK51_08450 [Armatimonadota bacterium]
MSIRNVLNKAAGLFVEMPESKGIDTSTKMAVAPTKTVEQIVADAPGPNLNEIKVPETTTTPVMAPGGVVQFQAVYDSAGLPKADFGAEQALEVINSLPAELPLNVKRTTVQATLGAMGKAMGVNTESVVADASRKLAALSAYEDMMNHKTNTYVGKLEAQIKDLETQIAGIKSEIADTQAMLGKAVGACQTEADRLDDVVEFFTLDTGASKLA